MSDQQSTQERVPFYQATWFVILMMFCCCFPIGLFLMWKYKKFNKPVRIIITGFFAIMVIAGIATSGSSSEPATSPNTSIAKETTAVPETTTIEETTTVPETTTVEETTTVPETTVPALSEDEFKASCQEISYKTLLRNPDEYIGTKIVLAAKVQQIVQGGLFDSSQYYRIQTDNSGYDLYLDDEYFMYDVRPTDTTKILQDDVLRVYAEFAGTETITRALTKTSEEIPSIKVYYIDILSE